MPPFAVSRLRGFRRSTGWLVVASVVVMLGTGATAVTAELQAGTSLVQSSGTADTTLPAGSSMPSGTTASSAGSQAASGGAPMSHRPKHLVTPTLFVTTPHGLNRRQARRVRHVAGVVRTQSIAAGHASVDGHRAFVVGVSPRTFRPWTPKLTADSNALWASVSRGELTASFDMGNDAKLPLGRTVSVSGAVGVTPMRVGAFASVGIAGVDSVVTSARARQIGLSSHGGVLVSAPKANPLQVRRAVLRVVGRHSRVELLQHVVVTRDAGEFLTRVQIAGFLRAAASRIGRPYVWGAAGPKSFDCSGLVQWSFARVGITMPRVAQEQYFSGPQVPYSQARPGDLLFWHYDPTDPTDAAPVAIYAGNGKMIVAPHTGEFVEYVPVPLRHLAGVVRVDPKLAAQIA